MPLSDAIAYLLADRRRIVMLQQLSERGLTALELGRMHDLKGPATLHHLHRLSSFGWIRVIAEERVPGAGAIEYRWAATPGVDWTAAANGLNQLHAQLVAVPQAQADS